MPRGMRRKEERRPPPPPMAASGMAGPCCRRCCCEVCGSGAATVFCHNDRAFLCDACDAEVHLRNPLAARHEVVSVSDQVLRDDSGVKVEASPGLDAMQQASLALGQAELSRSSSTSDHTALKGVPDEGLFDALDDFSVLELFTVGNFDHSCLDDFQQTELDQDWIESIEKECPQPVAPLTATPPRAPLATPPTTTPAAASTSATINEPRMRGPVEQPLLSQAGGLQCQAWNRSYDAIAGLPLATTPPGPPSLLPFLATSLCPPMVPLMPQSLPSHQPLQDSLDRKARVARYREKRKHRKFENKIRYATRKLYAESRPRIKGRFARPDELEAYLKEKEAKAQ